MNPDKLDDDSLDALHKEIAAMVERHVGGAPSARAEVRAEDGDDEENAAIDDPTQDEDPPASGATLKTVAEEAPPSRVRLLPLVEPDEGLEARILDATVQAQGGAPWHRKMFRGLAWAGSHAMRPQLAMAAVFVLVVGSSLLLVRAKPGTGVAPLRVTERGVPAPEMAADAPAATAAAAADPAPADDEQAGRRRDEAEENLEESKSKGEEADGSGAAGLLADARAARDSGGCAGAVAKYDQVGVAFPGTKESSSAMWEAAECYRSMGQDGKAMELWLALRADEGYRDKADAQIALTEGNPTQNQIGSAPGAGAGVASPSKAMAKPSPPAAPAPAEASPPGAADAPAAPDRAFEKAF